MPRLRLVGSGARAFLNGQTTVDFMEESPPAFLRGFWLNTAGRVRALFEARLIDEGAELLVLGGDFDEVIKGFDQVIFPSDNVRLDLGSEIRRVQLLVTKQPDRFSNVQWILPGDSLSGIVQNLNPSTPSSSPCTKPEPTSPPSLVRYRDSNALSPLEFLVGRLVFQIKSPLSRSSFARKRCSRFLESVENPATNTDFSVAATALPPSLASSLPKT